MTFLLVARSYSPVPTQPLDLAWTFPPSLHPDLEAVSEGGGGLLWQGEIPASSSESSTQRGNLWELKGAFCCTGLLHNGANCLS